MTHTSAVFINHPGIVLPVEQHLKGEEVSRLKSILTPAQRFAVRLFRADVIVKDMAILRSDGGIGNGPTVIHASRDSKGPYIATEHYSIAVGVPYDQ